MYKYYKIIPKEGEWNYSFFYGIRDSFLESILHLFQIFFFFGFHCQTTHYYQPLLLIFQFNLYCWHIPILRVFWQYYVYHFERHLKFYRCYVTPLLRYIPLSRIYTQRDLSTFLPIILLLIYFRLASWVNFTNVTNKSRHYFLHSPPKLVAITSDFMIAWQHTQ